MVKTKRLPLEVRQINSPSSEAKIAAQREKHTVIETDTYNNGGERLRSPPSHIKFHKS